MGRSVTQEGGKNQGDLVTGWLKRARDKLPLGCRLIQLDGCVGHHWLREQKKRTTQGGQTQRSVTVMLS